MAPLGPSLGPRRTPRRSAAWPPELAPRTSTHRPTMPLVSLTLKPRLCSAERVSTFATVPLVRSPVRWCCFCSTETSWPTIGLAVGLNHLASERAAHSGRTISIRARATKLHA